VIRDDTRRDKPGELQPAVAVRRAHHGNLDALISYVVHPFKRHLPNLFGGAYSDNQPRSDLGEAALVRGLTYDMVRVGARRGTRCDPAHQSGPRSNDQMSEALTEGKGTGSFS
jgi:hypothetical protein